MNISKTNDDIIRNLETNKSLGFPLNKHIELYISNHLEDPIKVIKYILFRYKFYLTGTKKINLGFPPYILIELVSSCNLKCPFCFQTDKSFTRKPYMGVINLEFFFNKPLFGIHLDSSSIWVVLPHPSIPSITINFPFI